MVKIYLCTECKLNAVVKVEGGLHCNHCGEFQEVQTNGN